MSLRLKEIEDQALLLPPEDQEMLVQMLVYRLENIPLTDVDTAWIEEAETRYWNFKTGKTQGIPGKHLFNDIRKVFGWQN